MAKDLKFDPRVVCAFCETILPLDEAAAIRNGGRLIAYLCTEHAERVSPTPRQHDRT